MNTNNRLLYLDNLKVCLTGLVIFHHAGQAYGDGGGWAYHPSNPAEFMPWLFREYVNCGNKFWQWCAAQSYGAYIFHLLLMIVLQHTTDGIWMGSFGKFMFIGIITTICSFMLTWLVKMIPGAKKVL